MDSTFDTAMLPEAFGTCACCVRESLDAAGVWLERTQADNDVEVDAWRMS